MNQYYDNHANDIEYFKFNKPKIVVKKKNDRLEFDKMSNTEVLEKLSEATIKREELTTVYNMTKHSSTFEQITKVTAFISIVRKELSKRNQESYEVLNQTISDLKSKLSELNSRSLEANEEEIQSLKLVNKNLKIQVCALEERVKDKSPQTLQSMANKHEKDSAKYKKLYLEKVKQIAEIRKNERAKIHEINVKSDKYICEYLKSYLSNIISKEEMQGVYEDLNAIRKENTPQ